MSEDIENKEYKEFSTEKKGYNKTEVQEYIDNLKVNLEEIQAKVILLEDEVKELTFKLEEYQKIDTQIRDTIIFLNDSERETLTKTQNEVSAMVKEAESKKEQIISEAEDEAKSTRNNLLFLKEQHEILFARIKIIIDSQEGMLNDFAKGNNSAHLQKTMAEAAAFRAHTELNIDAILEKLL